jgi:dipeptidyl-peptidase-4
VTSSTLALVVLLLAPRPAAAQAPAQAAPKDLTIADIFDPEARADFGHPAPALSWIDDSHYHWPRTDRRTRLTDHLRVEALSGNAEPLFDAGALESALAGVAGVSPEQARALARRSSYVMNARSTALLVTAADDLFLFDFRTRSLTRITNMAGTEEEPSFSPDGSRVAFVRGGNLYVVELGRRPVERASRATDRRTSSTGSSTGCTRRRSTAAATSRATGGAPTPGGLAAAPAPGGAGAALPPGGRQRGGAASEDTRYPKAGDPNPEVRLGIVEVSGAGRAGWTSPATRTRSR